MPLKLNLKNKIQFSRIWTFSNDLHKQFCEREEKKNVKNKEIRTGVCFGYEI